MADHWREYLESQRDSYVTRIQLMREGRIGTHERRDGKQVDTTAESIPSPKRT